MPPFKLDTPFKPCGHQPEAIAKLTAGVESGKRHQVLLGVTGSGKTFTMANLVELVQKPTLVLVHNKTLAGQLYQEFKQFFSRNAVEYFVPFNAVIAAVLMMPLAHSCLVSFSRPRQHHFFKGGALWGRRFTWVAYLIQRPSSN